MSYKKLQIEAHDLDDLDDNNDDLLRAAGVKRIHAGWYTVTYNGVRLDASTAVSAARNAKGEIK
jgi:hypothetical protein